jgi:uncharacterized glyoxalase superfamily protein PhnB
MAMQRLLINLCSNELEASKAFYTRLFHFQIAFDSDWFVNLKAPSNGMEIGLIADGHAIVPKGVVTPPQGFYLTIVVEDADAIYEKAKALSYTIVSPPEDTFYGQRRLLLKDPNGVVVDVSSLIKDFNP